jgi:predicted alpha/beta-hydrolase family hydrolase
MLLTSVALVFQVAAPNHLADLLPPGEHRVGFSQQWLIDSTRRLPSGERYGLRYRPVLWNLWYPAARAGGSAMRYADYINGVEGAAKSAPVRAYAAALVAYQRAVAWREIAGTARDSTAAGLRTSIDALFASTAVAVRDAPRLAGSFPIVVYAQGAGSSTDDNALLCEYLASRGYLVIGSAFPAEANDRFSTNASDESRQRDIKRLLLELTRHTGTDPGRVALIGHSAGAQAGFLMATDPSAPIDALLSLDTTQDYAGLSDRSWAYFTDKVIAARSALHLPIVFVAGPGALFELADSISGSQRTLLTVSGLTHNDFISQGVLRRRVAAAVDSGRIAARESAERGYRALASYLGDWLDVFHGRRATTASAPEPIAVTVAAPGERGPAAVPPTPRSAREVRHLFWTSAPAEFADRALRARAASPEIASTSVFMMLVVDAARRGDTERARAVLKALRERNDTAARVEPAIEARIQMFDAIGATDLARDWREVLRVLTGPPESVR